MATEDIFECNDPIVHYLFANDLVRRERFAPAITHYKHAIALDPDRLDAEVYLFAAWLLATCPEPSHRDGALAVQYARTACDVTEWSEWHMLTILAAAYAEKREFQQAVEIQTKALKLAEEEGYAEPEELTNASHWLDLLQSNQVIPYRPML